MKEEDLILGNIYASCWLDNKRHRYIFRYTGIKSYWISTSEGRNFYANNGSVLTSNNNSFTKYSPCTTWEKDWYLACEKLGVWIPWSVTLNSLINEIQER